MIITDKKHGYGDDAGIDHMNCDFGEYPVRFSHMNNDLIKRSRGYLVIRFRVLLRMLTQMFISRIEYVVALLIVLVQVYKGAIENLLILGIIFFAILVETHHGSSKWWNRLFYIYLFKCTVAYMLDNFSQTTDQGSQIKSIDQNIGGLYQVFFMIVGTPAYAYDAFILLSIFFVNIVLGMTGFSQKYLVEVEDPGTCIARMCINQKVNTLFMSKQKDDLEVFEERCNFIENQVHKKDPSLA